MCRGMGIKLSECLVSAQLAIDAERLMYVLVNGVECRRLLMPFLASHIQPAFHVVTCEPPNNPKIQLPQFELGHVNSPAEDFTILLMEIGQLGEYPKSEALRAANVATSRPVFGYGRKGRASINSITATHKAESKLNKMSRLTESITLALQSSPISSFFARHDRLTLISTATALLGTALVLPAVYRDYRIFKSYGPGGVPNNVFGWIAVRTLFTPFARDMFGTKVYERQNLTAEGGNKQDTGLLGLSTEQLSARSGLERPQVGPHPVPQRQLTQLPDEAVKQKFRAAFNQFADRNRHLVKLSPSLLEKHTEALFLADDIPTTPFAEKWYREISHFHGGKDYSVHALFSPADCKTLIEAGWAQRHAFSGTSAMTILTIGTMPDLPSEYLLVYAPRNEAEIEIVMQIIAASVRFMTMRGDVK